MRDAGFWTPQEDATIARLWLDGCSAGQISAVMRGRSRNAVIGRVKRLGIRRPHIADRSTVKRERPRSLRQLDDAARLRRQMEQRVEWESLRARRDPCVGCGVREDQHDEMGCKAFIARRAA